MQRDRLLIEEMISAASRAMKLVAGVNLDQLESDLDRRDALLWNFTVLGEAAAQVSDDVKAGHPQISWTKPSRLRNRIVHGYWSIDLSILHTTANDDLPDFVEQLRSVMAELDKPDPSPTSSGP